MLQVGATGIEEEEEEEEWYYDIFSTALCFTFCIFYVRIFSGVFINASLFEVHIRKRLY
jgi:hypothetical protein